MTTAGVLRCPGCHDQVAPADRFCEACGDTTLAVDLLDEAADQDALCCAACGDRFDGGQPEYCRACGMKPRAAATLVEAAFGTVAAASDRGRRHPRNEDAFAIAAVEDGRILAVVCDGVSTATSPDEASRVAADAGLDALVGSGSAGDDLEAAYRAARRAVREIPWVLEEERSGPPACTFLAASVSGSDVRLASMGDCRAYWLPQVGEPEILTVDDSWAAEQILAGRPPEALRGDPRCHSITRWLGRDADPRWMPRRVNLASGTGGRLVLCSDGLWNYAESAEEIAAATPDGAPAAVARRLVQWANAQGGQDNVTVVVIDVGSSGGDDPAQQKGRAR